MNREVQLATGMRSKKPCATINDASLGGLRSARQGFPSVVFCDGKTQQEIVRLARKLLAQHRHLLVPRVAPEVARALLRLYPRAVYHESARAVTVHDSKRKLRGDVLIVTAGTEVVPEIRTGR